MTMSKAALDRCKRLVIEPVSDPKGAYRMRLQVIDPRWGDRVVEGHISRTRQDTARIKTNVMARYSIPSQLVTEPSAEPAT